jgi:hypothetical protein
MAYHPFFPYIPGCLCSMLGVGSVLIKASISSSIVRGYVSLIVRGALEVLGVLGTLKSLLIGLGEEER